jgi:hypothetical protein
MHFGIDEIEKNKKLNQRRANVEIFAHSGWLAVDCSCGGLDSGSRGSCGNGRRSASITNFLKPDKQTINGASLTI